ncbi:hypothetical protein [Streptomyces sp. NRRL S-118]|uniref:hypothetical protein n=1 Tax=Streptomyces sp. NRRL S-118 TaxID=1463881 RepID=UPI0018FE6E0B|nr:hypothetical protein [Streptomyces sp. NRRL S-118]
MPVIDAWMQHPTLRHSNHEMFESLRRWTGQGLLEEPLPVKATVAEMTAADVEIGLSAAWYGPQGPLISNDEVAGSSPSPKDVCAGWPTRISPGRSRP